MKKAGDGLYDEVHATLALDQDASRDDLARLVDQVAAQIHPRDCFILFAAAHGYSLNGRFYLIPQDYQGGINPEALVTRAIVQHELQDWLANRIKAKRALILLDTCESGALIPHRIAGRRGWRRAAARGRRDSLSARLSDLLLAIASNARVFAPGLSTHREPGQRRTS